LLFALQAVAACNTVLGIEPAELGETTEPLRCDWPPPNPRTECAGCDEACLTNTCKVADCVTDKDCRYGMFLARKCVGSSCVDANGQCGGCGSDNPKAAKLANCVKGCGNCGLQGAATLCQSYCACMDQQCPENEPKSGGSCIKACMSGLGGIISLPVQDKGVMDMWGGAAAPSAAQIGCLWYHCESAPTPNDHFHCDHAIGSGGQCQTPQADDPNATLCPAPKRYGNSPCNESKDCCSGDCSDTGVCTAPR
jgi:hypothetical protein